LSNPAVRTPPSPLHSSEGGEAGHPSLARELTLLDATAIVVGTVIGSGIFLVPSSVAGQLDSLLAVLLVWIVGGALSLFGALSLAEMGAAFPGAGGLYVYLRHAFGRTAGFLYGWALLVMIHSGTIATLAVAFSLYVARLVPVGHSEQRLLSIGSILVLTVVNCLGIRAGKLVQNIFATAKLAGLLAMTGLLLARGLQTGTLSQSFLPDGPMQPLWIPFGVALVAVLWAYEGWHVVSFTAAEIRQPARDLPRSLLLGTVVVIACYLAANTAYYSVLTRPEIQQSDTVAATAMSKVFGPLAGVFISMLILVSIIGAMNGMVLTGPRVYYAMAEDGLFFRAFARMSARYRTPVLAIVVQGVWACVLTLFGTFQELFTYVIFTAWIFYGLAVAGVLVLRRTQPDLERPFRVPLFPWLPLFFCLAALGITLSTIAANPNHAAIGIGLVLTGIPAYFAFRRQTS